MTIAVAFTYQDNIYYIELEEGKRISLGSGQYDYVYIPSLKPKQFVLEMSQGKIYLSGIAPYQISHYCIPPSGIQLLSESKNMRMYITNHSKEPKPVKLPFNGKVTIGRNTNNMIVSNLSIISRNHLELKCKEGVITVKDLVSTNEDTPLDINIKSFDEASEFYDLPNPTMHFGAIYIDRKTKDYKYSVAIDAGSKIVVRAANKIAEEIINRKAELRRMKAEQEKNKEKGDVKVVKPKQKKSVYDSLVQVAYDKIHLIESTRSEKLDQSNKYSFLNLLTGKESKYRVEYNGNGHNYQAVIDAFHQYYKQHPSNDIIKDYQAALVLYARLTSIESISGIYNVLIYQLSKENKGEATLKIEPQPVLEQLGDTIEKYYDEFSEEKVNFDGWINDHNDYLYKHYGYKIPINNTQKTNEIETELRIKGETEQFKELYSYLQLKIKYNNNILQVIKTLEEATLKEINEFLEYVQVDDKTYSKEDINTLPSVDLENIIGYLGFMGHIYYNFKISPKPTICFQLTGCSKDIFACTTYVILSRIAKIEKDLLNISDTWTLDLKVPLGGKKGLFEYEMIIMRIFPWISIHEESSNEMSTSLKDVLSKQKKVDPFIAKMLTNEVFLQAYHKAKEEMENSIKNYPFLMEYSKKGMDIDKWNSLSEEDKLTEILSLGAFSVIFDRVVCVDFVKYIPYTIAIFLLMIADKGVKEKQLIDAGDGVDVTVLVEALNSLHGLCDKWECTIASPILVKIGEKTVDKKDTVSDTSKVLNEESKKQKDEHDIYKDFVQEAYDKICIYESKRADYQDQSCRDAFFILLTGEPLKKSIRYKGKSYTYQAIIDGFYKYYKDHPSSDMLKDYQNAIVFITTWTGVEAVEKVSDILCYHLLKEEREEATFKIDIETILDKLANKIKLEHDNLVREKSDFDNWLNHEEEIFKRYGYSLKIKKSKEENENKSNKGNKTSTKSKPVLLLNLVVHIIMGVLCIAACLLFIFTGSLGYSIIALLFAAGGFWLAKDEYSEYKKIANK